MQNVFGEEGKNRAATPERGWKKTCQKMRGWGYETSFLGGWGDLHEAFLPPSFPPPMASHEKLILTQAQAKNRWPIHEPQFAKMGYFPEFGVFSWNFSGKAIPRNSQKHHMFLTTSEFRVSLQAKSTKKTKSGKNTGAADHLANQQLFCLVCFALLCLGGRPINEDAEFAIGLDSPAGEADKLSILNAQLT